VSAAVAQQPKRREPVGTASERAFVDAKRRMGASWDAVAAMLNRSTIDVRRAFDPDFPHAAFPVFPLAGAPPAPATVMVCGQRVPVEGFSPEELMALKAFAPGVLVSHSAMRSRVSAVLGESVGVDAVRRLVNRLDRRLPEPLRVVRIGDDGWVIAHRPGAPPKACRPLNKAPPAPDPFGLGLPPVCVAVLTRLRTGEAVSFEDLQQSTVELIGRPLSQDSVRARISTINGALPPGARITPERLFGYRLTGGERLNWEGVA
jgi:hypothetical protein